ncbi:MAG: FtsX-like permease family protein [Actinomycetota bacterium]|nr:FtsX-like permease family protein [Actinomycetota bacterium]MDD5666952.1 FtsX-like permease family protein [Actinomycetota bacterium]
MKLLRKKLLREILESKFRFFAISSVVAIGILLFTASYMSFLNLSESYQHTYDRLHFADLLVRVDRAPERAAERLAELPNVDLLTPRVNGQLGMELEDGTRITGQIIGVPAAEPYVNMLYVREGSALTSQENELTCLVENHFAAFNELGEGDLIYAVKGGRRVPIRIAGVVSSPEYMVVFRNRQFPMTSATVFGVFYLGMDQARALTGFASNSYNEFTFTLTDYSLLETTERQVRSILKPYGIEEVTTRDNQISNMLVEMDLRSFHDFALFFPILFFSIAAFSIYMILSRLVRTQRPIIGLMRAVGYSSRTVLFHYMSFALVVGLVGVFLGSLLGWGATGIVSKVYSSVMKIPFVRYGTYPEVFLYGFLMAMGFCAISGIVPARRSAKVQPTEALRGVVDPTRYGKVTWVERLLPRIGRLRVFWRLPLRNIFRNRRRTAFTVIGIMFAIILIMLNLGINDTVNANMDQAFDHLFTFDIAVLFLDPQTRVTQNKIEKIAGVTVVEPAIGAPCTVSNGDEDVNSILMGTLVDTVMRGFLDEKNQAVEISPGHCLMSRNYRDQLSIDVGDMVKVSAFNRSRSFMVSEFIMEPMGSFVYVPVEEARDLLGYGTRSSAFYIQLDEGYYQEVRDALYDMPEVLTLVDLGQIEKEINSYMALMYIVIAVMLVFGLIMAFSLVFNTSTINIMEREQEVATMLTLGVPQWKASLSLTLENVIMGLLGLVPGYIAARFVMVQAMRLYETDLFAFTPAISVWTFIITGVIVIVLMVLSEFPSLRHIHRLNLAESTKRRSL